MVLAAEIKDTFGRFLLSKDSVIEAKHIRIMKMWGITSADIVGVDRENIAREEIDQIDPELLIKIRSHVDTIFCEKEKKDNDVVLKELYHLCVLRIAQRISEGELKESQLGTVGTHEDIEITAVPAEEELLSLDELVKKNVQFASFPDLYYRIIEVLNDTKSSASHLAEVVSSDPGLSATLLKLVNSAFYGTPSRINSITRAIALIGGRELSTLALGTTVISHFSGIPSHLVDMKTFWKHSIATGIFARILANRKVGLSEEKLFIAGLLHDIGRLIIFQEFPKTAAHAIRVSHKERLPLYEVEAAIMGYDHAKIAGRLLLKWNFPEELRQIIRYHHYPLSSTASIEASIVYAANIMASALQFGDSGDIFIPYFEKRVWDTIDISTSVLSSSLKQADRQVDEIMQIFSLNSNKNRQQNER